MAIRFSKPKQSVLNITESNKTRVMAFLGNSNSQKRTSHNPSMVLLWIVTLILKTNVFGRSLFRFFDFPLLRNVPTVLSPAAVIAAFWPFLSIELWWEEFIVPTMCLACYRHYFVSSSSSYFYQKKKKKLFGRVNIPPTAPRFRVASFTIYYK